MPRIIQIVRYVDYSNSAGPGTIALADTGKLYRLMEDVPYPMKWVEMPVPSLPAVAQVSPLLKQKR